MDVKRDYANTNIAVHWNSAKCTHSGNCVRGLPQVFDLKKHPWINVDAVDWETLAAQVDKCPSGALTWSRTDAPGGESSED